MQAAILSIGDELTLGENLNTNSQWLAHELGRYGVMTVEHRTVDDDRARIAIAARELAERCDVLIVTGGLGPTDDDLTRDALNDVTAAGKPMAVDEEARGWLIRWFSKRSWPMPEANLRQAMRPEPMRCLSNPHGTAPGLAGEFSGCLIFALPGPPREMRPMFADHVAAALGRTDGDAILSAKVNEFGLGESDAAERLLEMTSRDRRPLIGTTASESIVSARIRARGVRSEIEPLIESDCIEIQQRWWPYAFGRDDETLEEVIGALLTERGRTLATAESCTGGWLGKRLVDVAGSSAFYIGGWVTYSNEMKEQMLSVPMELIDRHGAVSREVAETMAIGALERSGADEALAISGVAGPSGGTKHKPIGTVHIALTRRARSETTVHARHFIFAGDRTTIRDRSVKAALQMLRFALLDVDESHPLLWERVKRPDVQTSTCGVDRSSESPKAVDAYIALGSNLGDRAELLNGALNALRGSAGVEVVDVSEFIETEPVGPGDQENYLNAAAKLRTTRSPRDLLELLLAIERNHGRDRGAEQRWGPRLLDLDVLLYGGQIIDEPGLTIPHPRMHERSFVLDPLARIAGDVRHPLLNERIQSIRDRLLTGRSEEGIRS